ncbi:hypothetical protein [Roseisalinus antarcticus]|uniref:hypothetical protein n=1 Tax=Roseisalinus antarcticus TaxID=254357 RepID=UPI0013564F78|nr:hypothetical protein [Roseisalinus antarcticus]
MQQTLDKGRGPGVGRPEIRGLFHRDIGVHARGQGPRRLDQAEALRDRRPARQGPGQPL